MTSTHKETAKQHETLEATSQDYTRHHPGVRLDCVITLGTEAGGSQLQEYLKTT